MRIATIRDAVSAFSHFFEDITGRPSSSMRYPPKLIYYFLKMYRNAAAYSDQRLGSGNNYDLNTEMTIPCVELIKVDQIECPCAPASGCYFLKSKYPLPRMRNGIPNSVTMLKQHKTQQNYGIFTYVDWYRFEDKLNGRLSGQALSPYFTMKNIVNGNRHLYVHANIDEYSDLKAVSVALIPNDPLELLSFPVCGSSEQLCNPLDVEFIIEDEIQNRVFEMTFAALNGFKSTSLGADLLNNDNNDAIGGLGQTKAN